jgi:cation diffusion facilitator CzcD-associated flavoprotein CzcO
MIVRNPDELALLARADLQLLSYPQQHWVRPRSCAKGPIHTAIIVGGGQSGLVIAAALRRAGVDDVVILDKSPKGFEGVWETFARMKELRTPKALNGMDFGCPNLSVQRWFITRYGQAAWDRLQRIPRTAWMEYLRWYRETMSLAVENETEVTGVWPEGDVIAVETQCRGKTAVRLAQTVVLATGYDGAGQWAVPEFVSNSLPASRFNHTNKPIDFERFRGKRLAVLGHAASAFDAANAALEHGAKRVDLCFRRKRLPRINPQRFLETAGTMTHFFELPDSTKWEVARFFEAEDQPPPVAAFADATGNPRFRMHPGCPWLSVYVDGDEVVARTPQGEIRADHLLLGTGSKICLESRPELEAVAPEILRWRDCHPPAQGTLGALPYLSAHYEFKPKRETGNWVSRMFCFNYASAVSHGPHSTSIAGHRHCVPRAVRGLTSALFAGQAADFVSRLRAFSQPELMIPDDFEANLEPVRVQPPQPERSTTQAPASESLAGYPGPPGLDLK